MSDGFESKVSERPPTSKKVPYRTMLALPYLGDVYGEVFPAHIATIVEALRLHEDDRFFTCYPRNIYPHDRSRQFTADAAVRAKCDKLFFIDMDTVVPRGAIATMYSVMEQTGCQAVSGYYLRRGYPYTPVWSVQREDKRFYQVDALPGSGLVPLDMTGFGCCLIDFEWVQKNMSPPWFRMKQTDLYTEITDDAVFFEKLKAAGGKLFGVPDVQCGHYGDRELSVRESADQLRASYIQKDLMMKVQLQEMQKNESQSVGTITPCGVVSASGGVV